ncbi:MAG: asparagine synthase-related protein [Solirubrobacterales bacterium]
MLAGFAGRLYYDGRRAAQDAQLLAQKLLAPAGYRKTAQTCGALSFVTAVGPDARKNETAAVNSKDGCHVFFGAGTLYNRKELLRDLKAPLLVSETELMCLAWEQWRASAPARLDGDWMFAVYDSWRDELALARSWGHSSLYYHCGSGFFAFATHPAAITGLPGVPARPDLGTVSQLLGGTVTPPEATCWEGVKQLSPGSMLTLSNGRIKETNWWSPGRVREARSLPTNEQVLLDRFIDLYEDAVHRRLVTPRGVGAVLKDSLDSASLCVLAAEGLGAQSRPLHIWTAAPLNREETAAFRRWGADEREAAAAVAGECGNIRHTPLAAPDRDPITAISNQIVRTGQPDTGGRNQFWTDEMLMKAQDANCGVLLTDHFFGANVSWVPPAVALFPKNRFYGEASWAEYYRLVKSKAERRLKWAAMALTSPLELARPVHPLLNHTFLESAEYRQGLRMAQSEEHTRAGAALMRMNRMDRWYHEGYWNGIEVRDPALDLPLTEFLLSLPDRAFYQNGMDQRVLRLGMAGKIPDSIRLGPTRRPQTEDIVPRVRRFGASARAAFESIQASLMARELLNLDRVDKVLKAVLAGENGPGITKRCTEILLPAVSIGLFLAHFDSAFDWHSLMEMMPAGEPAFSKSIG